MEIDGLVFERSPQAFDKDIVHPASATVDADPDLGILEHRGEVEAGELTALIAVKDFRAAQARQRFRQR
jgi:hypothetical protein